MGETQRIEITPRTWVEVRVLKPVLTWNSMRVSQGETFVAEHYQVAPAIKVGQVELVAALPDYKPTTATEELLVATEPPPDDTETGKAGDPPSDEV